MSLDIGEFGEGVSAYSRLLELRGKHVDEPVLGIMVRAVDENLMDCKGQPGNESSHMASFYVMW